VRHRVDEALVQRRRPDETRALHRVRVILLAEAVGGGAQRARVVAGTLERLERTRVLDARLVRHHVLERDGGVDVT
jgi:hypothetical protein